MKIKMIIQKKIQNCFFLLICLIVLLFQSHSHKLNAFPMDKYKSELVTEELRLEVPSKFK